jgi:hypothetical protein
MIATAATATVWNGPIGHVAHGCECHRPGVADT